MKKQRRQHREDHLFYSRSMDISNILNHGIVNTICLFYVLAERIIKNERKIVELPNVAECC